MSSGDSLTVWTSICLFAKKQTRFCFPYQAILVLYQVERYIGKYFLNDKAHILHQMESFYPPPPNSILFEVWWTDFFFILPKSVSYRTFDTVPLQVLNRAKVTVHFFLNHTVVILSNNLQRRNFAKCLYIHFLD